MEIFTDEFLESLPENTFEGLKVICNQFREFDQSVSSTEETEFIEEYIEAFAVLQSYLAGKGIKDLAINLDQPYNQLISQIRNYFRNADSDSQKKINQIKLEETTRRLTGKFGNNYIYSFTEADTARIQELINILREEIGKNGEIDIKHKQRLMNKLEKLQGEVHKKESDLDKYFGLAGEVLGLAKKTGDAALPWIKCVKEILHIVGQAQTVFLGLPSSTSMNMITNQFQEKPADQTRQETVTVRGDE